MVPQDIGVQALIIGLALNWDGIRLLLEPLPPSLKEELSGIARRLEEAETEDELSIVIDDLLDLTKNTAAEPYVKQLVARFSIERSATRELQASLALDVPESLVTGTGKDDQRDLAARMTVNCGFEQVPLFYATNRTRATKGKIPFAAEPANAISYGMMLVTIPATHRMGKIETPHWWTLFPSRHETQRFISLQDIRPLSPPEFGTQLETQLRGADAKDLLVFLHGYNVTFEEGAQRAAQLAFDMKFPGAVILFSWPSAGELLAYQGDEERAGISADSFSQFLRSLEGGPWNRVHIVAHSMGNRVMIEGLIARGRPKLPLGQLVFAAADVYPAQFRQRFPELQAPGTLLATSYASNRDRALKLSNWLHRNDRVGLIRDEPFTAPMLETVDASAVETGFLSMNHSSIAEERSIITDMRTLLAHGLSARSGT